MISDEKVSKKTWGRKPELDGIRGFAILLVMVFHYLSDPLTQTSGSFATMGKSLRLFWSGVDLFFVLSGFLLGGVLLQNRHAKNLFSVFFLRRCCRIVPPYLLLLLSFVVLSSFGHGQPWFEHLELGTIPFWSYFAFVQNIYMCINHTVGSDWLAVTWSLAVEEQFYLVLPFMVYFLPARKLTYVAIAGCFGALLLRTFDEYGFYLYVSSPTRADSVLAGLLLAIAMRSNSIRQFLERHQNFIGGLVMLAGLGMLALTFNRHIFGVALYTWTTFFYTGLVCLASLGWPRWLYHFFTLRWLQFTGIISYGLYLFHTPAGYLADYLGLRFGIPRATTSGILLTACLATLIAYTIATFCYHSFEKHFVRLGHRLSYAQAELSDG